MKKLRLASLFSGCGGMDLGFEGGFQLPYSLFQNDPQNQYLPSLGIETVFACDINKYAQAAWENYFSKHRNIDEVYHLESIVHLVKNIEKGKMPTPNSIDIVTGGFPCNDFSVAGKRLGFNSHKSHTGETIEDPNEENRGMLYFWMRKFIGIVQPKVFYAENVAGLTSLEEVFQTICKDFSNIEGAEYHLEPVQTLNSANYGAPQNRRRVIFIGIKKTALKKNVLEYLQKHGELPKNLCLYPKVTHGIDHEPILSAYYALQDLDEPHLSSDLSQQKYSKAKYQNNGSQGQTEIPRTAPATTIRAEHHGNIEFRRLSIENGGIHIDELKQGKIQRRLTVRECARLQTFPDDYEFVIKNSVSASQAYRMIGNAVPPLLGYKLAERLLEVWNDLFIGSKKIDTQLPLF